MEEMYETQLEILKAKDVNISQLKANKSEQADKIQDIMKL